MKHLIIILALITASIQTFAQSPRIKLNQITKDSVTGSVLISSPTDSGMVYSRDLFISYGADTVLILGGDTLAATSSIISSVLSDGVTITGDGTTGSELTADTSVLATLRALSDSLALVISSVTADNVTITGDGTVGSPLTVDTATVVATKGDLDLYYLDSNPDGYTSNTGTVTSVAATAGTGISVSGSPITTSGTLTITNTAPDQTVSIAGGGINAVTGTYPSFTVTGTEVDGSVTNEIQDISTTGAAGNISISSGSTLNLNVDDSDASASNEGSLTVGAGTASTSVISSNTSGSTDVTLTAGTNVTLSESGNNITIAATGGGTTYNNISETADTVYISDYLDVDTSTLYVDATNNRVGIGTSTPDSPLDVIGAVSIKWGLDQNTSQAGLTIGADLNPPVGQSTLTDEFPKGGAIHGYHYDNDEPQIGLLLVSSTSTLNNVVFGNYSNSINGPTRMLFRTANTAGYPNSFVEAMLIDSTGAVNFDYDLNNSSVSTMYVDATNNRVGIGTTSPSYKLDVNGNVRADTYYYDVTSTLQSSSDSRLKQNITNMDNVLDKLKELELVKYEWNDIMYKKLEGRTSQSKLGGTFEGMIAQQVESLFPQYVGEDADGYKTLSYVSFVIPLLKGFQEQQSIIESQATEIETLKTLITELSNRLQILENN